MSKENYWASLEADICQCECDVTLPLLPADQVRWSKQNTASSHWGVKCAEADTILHCDILHSDLTMIKTTYSRQTSHRSHIYNIHVQLYSVRILFNHVIANSCYAENFFCILNLEDFPFLAQLAVSFYFVFASVCLTGWHWHFAYGQIYI